MNHEGSRENASGVAQANARYRRLHESLTDGFAAVDLKGQIVESNAAFQQLVGYTAQELAQMSYQQLTPAKWHLLEARILEEQLFKRGFTDVYQKEYIRRDGTTIPVELRTHLETNDAGEPVGAWAIVRDVSDRIKVMRELEEKELRLSLAISATSDAIWEWDLVTKITYYSPRWFEMLGYPDQSFQMNEGTFRELCHPDDYEPTISSVQSVILAKGGQGFRCEFRMRARDGSWRWILGRGNVVKRDANGQCVLLSGTNTDITDYKAAEMKVAEAQNQRAQLERQLRQVQKMEAIGTLAGGIAHDFNNILGAIVAFVDLAKIDAEGNLAVQESLDQVTKASDRARELVRQILLFSRQNKVERQTVKLQATVREALRMVGATLPKKIQISSNLSNEAGPVFADTNQIHQVIVNLCTNAAHAMANVQGRLEVGLDEIEIDEDRTRANPDLRVGRYVRLIVSDNGQGMDADVLSRIFEPFFTTKGPGEGTGLGLSVVHGIVRDHDGGIQVTSQPGRGSVFELFFPTHKDVTSAEIQVTTPLVLGRGEKILFVDDESALCLAAEKVLRKNGFVSSTFSDPREALIAFTRQPDSFAAVFTDLAMPGMSGIELAQRMLKIRPSTPIVLVSGFSGTWTLEKIQQLGIKNLLAKPINQKTLVEAVQSAIAALASVQTADTAR